MNRGAIAQISLSAIAFNLQTVRNIVKSRPVIAVVKADAYGHGAIEVSKKLLREGVPCLAVAYISEAVELRDAGVESPVVVLFDSEDSGAYFDYNLTPAIHSIEVAFALSSEAERRNRKLSVQVKIDTGMGRLGLHDPRIIDDLLTIADLPGVDLHGLLSHFSEADLLDRSFALVQLDRFNAIRNTLSQRTGNRIFAHMANSAAVLSFEDAHLDAVRPGLMLYGYSPFGKKTEIAGRVNPELRTLNSELPRLIPAMTVRTRVLSLRKVPAGTPISYGRTFVTKRPSLIGVIPVGYADGFNRLFSNNADFLIKGRRAPVVGRVCMDLTMTDVTDIEGVSEYDEVVIMGKQGGEEITADELAARANTISYEILTSLGSRSKRTYD